MKQNRIGQKNSTFNDIHLHSHHVRVSKRKRDKSLIEQPENWVGGRGLVLDLVLFTITEEWDIS